MLVKVSGAVPELVTAMAWGADEVPALWLAKVRLVGLKLMADWIAVPVMGTVCGLLAAVSVTTRFAVRAAGVTEVGLNTTLMVQLPPAATDAGRVPQMLVCEKSVALVPVKPMLEMVSTPVPVALLTVTGSAAEAEPTVCGVNATGLGVTTATGVPTWPVPLSPMVCGLPKALSAMDSLAVNAPTAAGVKVTEIVQLAPAASVAVQVLVWPKSAALVPVMVTAMPVRVAPPLLESFTVCAVEGIFTGWGRKVRLVASKLATGTAETLAIAETLRTRLLFASLMSRSPLPSTARP